MLNTLPHLHKSYEKNCMLYTRVYFLFSSLLMLPSHYVHITIKKSQDGAKTAEPIVVSKKKHSRVFRVLFKKTYTNVSPFVLIYLM